jgi:regulator of cell morphogenesis and NO signaling
MSIEIPENLSVGQIVARYPETRQALEEMGIDYCCGGKQPIGQACRKAGLNCRDVTNKLVYIIQQPQQTPSTNWLKASLTELTDHIERRHHTYMRQNLPRLAKLAEKVYNAHKETHGQMIEQLIQSFELLRVDIEMHLAKEEQVLFPIIRQMDSVKGQGQVPAFHCGSIQNPIGQMEYEHDAAGDMLAQMRKITSEYQLPPDACQSFKALYDGIQDLELDLHEHIHLENNILFPRAAQMESTLCR